MPMDIKVRWKSTVDVSGQWFGRVWGGPLSFENNPYFSTKKPVPMCVKIHVMAARRNFSSAPGVLQQVFQQKGMFSFYFFASGIFSLIHSSYLLPDGWPLLVSSPHSPLDAIFDYKSTGLHVCNAISKENAQEVHLRFTIIMDPPAVRRLCNRLAYASNPS